MLATLLESRAPRPRRAGGTALSLLVHGALIAGAVGLTATGTSGAAPTPRAPIDSLTWVIKEPPADPVVRHAPAHADAGPAQPRLPGRTVIDISGVVPPNLPPIDIGARPIEEGELVIGHHGIQPVGTGVIGARGVEGGVIGERDVDRAPTVIGEAPTPRYPEGLRAAGITGRVVVQFVVDTLGCAEREVEVVESPRTEFTEAVRAALRRFRFTPGEVAGRRVRTRVQVPFDFTLR